MDRIHILSDIRAESGGGGARSSAVSTSIPSLDAQQLWFGAAAAPVCTNDPSWACVYLCILRGVAHGESERRETNAPSLHHALHRAQT